MRLALKYQIILAPAVVLLLMTFLLIFLQYTYWDLSVKRQEAKRLGTVFIALAEADLATQRMYGLSLRLADERLVDVARFQEMAELYHHLEGATERILTRMSLADSTRAMVRQAVKDLDPEFGFDPQRFLSAISLLRPQLASISGTVQKQRENLRDVHKDDIDALVARTAAVSIVVLGAAIALGVVLALAFARHILRRIQVLSDAAGRIARGELTPPAAPEKVRDELDDLALSINGMTDRLIRVVSTEKLLEGAEEERRRIAMDIHDQTLSDLSSVLRGIQDLKKGECSHPAAKLEADLQKAMANLREVMDNLHPPTLDILGLGAALESHLEHHMTLGGLPEYHFYAAPSIESALASRVARLTFYRIAVEAIHNVVKHSAASRYEVNLDKRGGEVVLSVEDNGCGFDLEKILKGGGRGLNNIRERARAIGATVQWGASRFSSGTRFELSLPVADRSENG
jgi:two-component system, NarL family, sensor histidine kinase UhpB